MKSLTPILAVLSAVTSLALAEAPSADQVVSQAEAKAATEHRAIFVHFGTSWCGWCKRLDAFLQWADIKPVIGKYFIPVKLVVQEGERT